MTNKRSKIRREGLIDAATLPCTAFLHSKRDYVCNPSRVSLPYNPPPLYATHNNSPGATRSDYLELLPGCTQEETGYRQLGLVAFLKNVGSCLWAEVNGIMREKRAPGNFILKLIL